PTRRSSDLLQATQRIGVLQSVVLIETGVHTCLARGFTGILRRHGGRELHTLRRGNRRSSRFGIAVRAERNRIGARTTLGLAEIVPLRTVVRTSVLRCLILGTALLHRQALGAVIRCRSSGLLGWGSNWGRSRGCSSRCVVTALSLAEIVPLHVAKRAGILGRLIL